MRAPRRRPGPLEWPSAILGEPSNYEAAIFALLKSGMGPHAGALDALQLGNLAKQIVILRATQERLSRTGTLITTGSGIIQNPDVKTVAALAGVVQRGLQACGLNPLLLDRAPKSEGAEEDRGDGRIDDAGVFWPSDGSPGYYVGKPQRPKAAKVVKLQPKAPK